jgi:hypothetical protein
MFVPSLRSQPPSDTDIITDLNRDALTLMLLWMLAYGNLGTLLMLLSFVRPLLAVGLTVADL